MKSATRYIVAIALLSFLSLRVAAQQPTTAPATTHPARFKVVLIGDSTVTDKSGWGVGFAKLLDDQIECINLSKGGRSSKSYIEEGAWKDALTKITPGSYVLIQFGHNDQPGKGPERETDPATTYPQFMSRYVDDVRAAGAKPILVTSLTRRRFGPDGKINSDLFPYVNAVKKISADKNVPLIDLHQRSIELCDQMGRNCNDVLGPKVENGAKPDSTHLSPKGSELVGKLVAEELKHAAPELAPHIRS